VNDSRTKTIVYLAVGVALIAAYLIALRSMWLSAGTTDIQWARRSQLMTGLEALAFAAAGTLLGTTVQRAATKEVEATAERERGRADENAGGARAGEAMRASIEAKLQAGGERFGEASVSNPLKSELVEILAAGAAAREAAQ